MSGKEVLKRMRDSGYRKPVVICGGYSESEILNQFAGCGFAAFMQKPFKTNELTWGVSDLLRAVSAGDNAN